jgi:hypothetical protein
MTENDQAFLQALEACVLPEADFGHAAHVRAAYLYLRAGEFSGATPRSMRGRRIRRDRRGRLRKYYCGEPLGKRSECRAHGGG